MAVRVIENHMARWASVVSLSSTTHSSTSNVEIRGVENQVQNEPPRVVPFGPQHPVR